VIVFFDTETTGFCSKKHSAKHEKQAHLVQVAAQLVTPDDELVTEFSTVVASPVPSHPKAEAVHGISHGHCLKYGMDEKAALDLLQTFFVRADQRVAHNIKFDDEVIRLARKRHEDEESFAVEAMTDPRCTMTVVKRMGLSGKLDDCIRHFFDEDLEGHHDAMEDVRACRRLFFELRRLGRM